MAPIQRFTLFISMIAGSTAAHSWIEQLSNVAPDGTYMSAFGYPRGFVDKGVANFDQNSNMWQLPPAERVPWISKADLVCHPAQRVPLQSPNFPRLVSRPGTTVAMRYAEGGHATLPNGGPKLFGKPKLGGTVFVFGTDQPREEERLLDVLQWTHDGQGGDRRGRLLTSQNFDDGRCYELGNKSPLATSRMEQTPNAALGQLDSTVDLLCETDVKLPLDAPPGQFYTLYWVWQWPTAPGVDPNQLRGRDEYYTSCVDVDIANSIPSAQKTFTLAQQGSMSSAVRDFVSRGALTTNPLAPYSDPAFHNPLPTQA